MKELWNYEGTPSTGTGARVHLAQVLAIYVAPKNPLRLTPLPAPLHRPSPSPFSSNESLGLE